MPRSQFLALNLLGSAIYSLPLRPEYYFDYAASFTWLCAIATTFMSIYFIEKIISY